MKPRFPDVPSPASAWVARLPYLTLALFLGVVAALVWLTRSHDQDEQRATLINDVLWMEQNLQFHLDRTAGQLAQIGAELLAPGPHAAQTDAALRQLVRTESGLTRVLWLDADGNEAGAMPPLSGAHLIGETRGAVPAESTFRLARATGRRVYGPTYEVAGGGQQFEVHVPVYSQSAFLGVAVGMYSLQDLVVRELPWWFSERYRVSVLDAEGREIAAKSKVAPLSDERRYTMAFDPPGHGLTLQITAYQGETRWVPVLLMASITLLSAIIVWSIWQLRRQLGRRQAAEQALRSESLFRRAMEDSLLTGLRARDLDGRITYVNPAFCRMVGYSAEELVGRTPPMPYWDPAHLEHIQEVHDQIMAGGTPPEGVELRLRRKNGERLDARFYLSPLIDLTGKQTGWMASVTDITEPKRVRAALEAAHERFAAVLDGLEAAVFVADADTDEILFANRAFKSIHGFDAVGRTVRGVAVPQPERGDYRVDPRGLTAADLPRELFDGELQHPLSGRWYHVREHATRWVDGRVVRMGIATDITDRKQTADITRQQAERLQRTSRLITMGEMASTLAHELNQPLSAIANYCMGCVTRIQSGSVRQEDLLAAMQKASFQAERAGKIIRRVREFVKKSEPRRSAVHIAEVLEDAIGFAEIDARRMSSRIVSDVTPELPPVFADRIMIEQVVLNLVKNGIDAMTDLPADQRVLLVRARAAGPRAVEVSVVDRGHGIGEEERARLFTPFYTTKAEGMGMGLNICRSIIEFHDGRLIVDSNPEGGTIFSFTLPTEIACERVARRA